MAGNFWGRKLSWISWFESHHFLHKTYRRASPTYMIDLAFYETFLCEMLTSYWSTEIFSIEYFLLHGTFPSCNYFYNSRELHGAAALAMVVAVAAWLNNVKPIQVCLMSQSWDNVANMHELLTACSVLNCQLVQWTCADESSTKLWTYATMV